MTKTKKTEDGESARVVRKEMKRARRGRRNKPKRGHQLKVLLSTDELASLRRSAAQDGENVSQWVRRLIRLECRQLEMFERPNKGAV